MQEAARVRKKCRGNTGHSQVFLPTLLECSSGFLSALQQNRAQSRLLHSSYDKQSVKFPTHYFQFSKQTIGQWRDSFRSVFYTLIKHAFSTNQSVFISELYYKSIIQFVGFELTTLHVLEHSRDVGSKNRMKRKP